MGVKSNDPDNALPWNNPPAIPPPTTPPMPCEIKSLVVGSVFSDKSRMALFAILSEPKHAVPASAHDADTDIDVRPIGAPLKMAIEAPRVKPAIAEIATRAAVRSTSSIMLDVVIDIEDRDGGVGGSSIAAPDELSFPGLFSDIFATAGTPIELVGWWWRFACSLALALWLAWLGCGCFGWLGWAVAVGCGVGGRRRAFF